jgi:hypothetical protein
MEQMPLNPKWAVFCLPYVTVSMIMIGQSVKWYTAGWMATVPFQGRGDVSLCHYIQNSSVANPDSYLKDTIIQG